MFIRVSTCKRISFITILSVTVLLTACGADDNSKIDEVCTTEARSSISLTVLDTLGLPIRAYDVAFQINNGAMQKVSCDSNEACAIEYEKSGLFSMTVSKPGFNATSLDVTVTRDACHVMTQRVTLTLKAF